MLLREIKIRSTIIRGLITASYAGHDILHQHITLGNTNIQV